MREREREVYKKYKKKRVHIFILVFTPVINKWREAYACICRYIYYMSFTIGEVPIDLPTLFLDGHCMYLCD